MEHSELTEQPTAGQSLELPSRSLSPVVESPMLRSHSRSRRNRNIFYEIDIPPLGITSTQTSAVLILIALLLFGLSLTLIPLMLLGILEGLLLDSSVVSIVSFVSALCVVWFIIIVLGRVIQGTWFRREVFRVTVENYILVKKYVSLPTIVKCFFIPSYRNLLRTNTIQLTRGKKFHGHRQPQMEAKVSNVERIWGKCRASIEFGALHIGHGLSVDELHFLVDEINQFLGHDVERAHRQN